MERPPLRITTAACENVIATSPIGTSKTHGTNNSSASRFPARCSASVAAPMLRSAHLCNSNVVTMIDLSADFMLCSDEALLPGLSLFRCTC